MAALLLFSWLVTERESGPLRCANCRNVSIRDTDKKQCCANQLKARVPIESMGA